MKTQTNRPIDEENCHAGHRERVYETLKACNFEPVQEHIMLEFLLFDCFKRIDTNPLAHRLINKFGNFCNVFEAKEEDIAKVHGMGKASARILKNFYRFKNYFSKCKRSIKLKLTTPKDYANFFKDKFATAEKENLGVVALSDNFEVLSYQIFESLKNNEIKFDIRSIYEVARSCDSYRLVLIHNHPSGDPTPSQSDRVNTNELYKQLIALRVEIHNHIIVSENSFFSFDKHHLLEEVKAEYGTIDNKTHEIKK